MPDTITISDLAITGRLNAPDPKEPRVTLSRNLNFATAQAYTFDFGVINQQNQIGIIRAMFIDNGSNPTNVEIAVEGTDQYFEVPAYAQGTFKIDANQSSRISLSSDGGATDQITVTFYNHEVPLNVWYRFGAFNNLLPIQAQGTMQEGDIIAAEANNKPIYFAGRSSADGSLVPIRTDALGRLDFATSITVGGVFGSDPMGAPPVNPGFPQAVLNSAGNLVYVQLNAAGEFLTRDADVLAAVDGLEALVTATNAKLDTIIENTDKGATGTQTSVAGAAADTTILAANTNRQGATVYNDSTAILYLLLANAVSSTSVFTAQIAAGGYYEVPAKYTGIIKGLWASATGNARVTEIV